MTTPADKPGRPRVGLQARINIDRILEQTPCLCGATDTWHQTCYAGKTDEQIEAIRDRVYAKVRRTLRSKRKSMATAAIELGGLG